MDTQTETDRHTNKQTDWTNPRTNNFFLNLGSPHAKSSGKDSFNLTFKSVNSPFTAHNLRNGKTIPDKSSVGSTRREKVRRAMAATRERNDEMITSLMMKMKQRKRRHGY